MKKLSEKQYREKRKLDMISAVVVLAAVVFILGIMIRSLFNI